LVRKVKNKELPPEINLPDDQRLRGAWQVIAGERQGKPMTDTEARGFRITVTGNRVHARF
jgi:hypothetical protein